MLAPRPLRAALLAVGLLAVGNGMAQSLSLSASAFSEPVHLGLSESDGQPGVALTADLEFGKHLYGGLSGMRARNAERPNRSKSGAAYVGVQWSSKGGKARTLAAVRRFYPGSYQVSRDYTEFRFDSEVTRSVGLMLSAADDYYGIGERSLAVVGRHVRDISDRLYTRLELGHLHVSGDRLPSYSFGVVGAGVRFERFSLEAGYQVNDAEPYAIFTADQTDDRLVLQLSWLIY